MRIFVSFHDEDEALYREIKGTLKKIGGVEFYRRSLDGLGPKGLFDTERLYESLGHPDAAIAILSPHYLAEPWFDHELPALFALEGRLKTDIILPVLAPGVSDEQIPMYLKDRDYIDCRGSTAEGMTSLAEYVNRARQREVGKVFLAHGHDNEAKESVARFIEKLGLEVVILHEQASRGRTIIEKLEDHTDACFAIVLLTPDDVGAARKDAAALQPRARQNVVFELGLFVGKLGRGHVCALQRGAIERPSDYHGVAHLEMDEGGGWRERLADEMRQGGCVINMGRVLG